MKLTLTAADASDWYEATDKMRMRRAYWWTGTRLLPSRDNAGDEHLDVSALTHFCRLVEASAPSPAAADEPIVVGGREVNVQSKWLGGDPPFVVTDGKCEGLDSDGQWSNKLLKMKEFKSHESATDFARQCAASSFSSPRYNREG